MDIVAWNAEIKKLRDIILKEDKIKESIEICLALHSMVHISQVSGTKEKTFEDELWEGLDDNTFRKASKDGVHTIAYALWHCTRIEDITTNILITSGNQIFNTGNWADKINTKVIDTGNAMTKEEILEFSNSINIQELRNYRAAVGKNTRELIKDLSAKDMKRKFDKDSLKRILDEGAVKDVEASKWLIDFWGRKNVSGILLMPVTRHQVVHINESVSAKKKKLK
jgi:hypothetical protein